MASRLARLHGRGLSVSLVALAALAAGGISASVVVHLRDRPHVVAGGGGGGGSGSGATGLSGGATGALPGAGSRVPAFDLASDPVFPTLSRGYAIERHTSGGVTSEHLAESRDGGASWFLTGSPFPFETGYSQIQFDSLSSGYAFGPAGLAITHDGGRRWQRGAGLGSMQRVVPIGTDVWATYSVCTGPPLPSTTCRVALGISSDGGLRWRHAGFLPLSEARSGGNILARVTTTKAYVVSYGVTGGGLALTLDSGLHWQELPDPCATWRTADLAALSGGDLWLVCGGSPVLGGKASAKAVFRSYDGGHHFQLEASTGFGPAPAPAGGASGGPFGTIAFGGRLSQLATISPDQAWIGVSGVGVLVTNDGGHTWQPAVGVTDAGHDDGVGVTFNDARHGWAIEFHEGVLRTSDGVHWRLVDGT